jgi:hypothetical protein
MEDHSAYMRVPFQLLIQLWFSFSWNLYEHFTIYILIS